MSTFSLRHAARVFTLALLAASSGCVWGGKMGLREQITAPGTAQEQQTRAKRFDPYLRNDTETMALSDVRPRDYTAPLSDTEISRAGLSKQFGQRSKALEPQPD